MAASAARDKVGDNFHTDRLVASLGWLAVQQWPSQAELATVVELVRNHGAVLVNVGYG